jgi:hypothetical protein
MAYTKNLSELDRLADEFFEERREKKKRGPLSKTHILDKEGNVHPFDPVGLLSTAGNRFLFGVPRGLSKNIDRVAREYEESNPTGGKASGIVGEIGSYVLPMKTITKGAQLGGKGIAKVFPIAKELVNRKWKKGLLEGAAVGGTLGGLDTIGREDKDMGGIKSGAAAGAAVGALTPGLLKIARAAGRKALPSISKSKVTADIARDFEQGIDRETIEKSLKENKELIKLLSPKEVGYLRGSGFKSPEVSEKLSAMRDRFENDLQEKVDRSINKHISPEGVDKRIEGIRTRGASVSKPYYEAAYKESLSDPESIQKLEKNPFIRRALNTVLNSNNELAEKYTSTGKNPAVNRYAVEVLDEAKRALDSKLNWSKANLKGYEGEMLKKAIATLKNQADKASPMYRQARGTAEDYLKHQSLADEGIEYLKSSKPKRWRDFQKGNPLEALGEEEKKSVRSGFGSALKEEFARSNKNLDMFNKSEINKKIGEIIGEQKLSEGFGKEIKDLSKTRENLRVLSANLKDYYGMGDQAGASNFVKAAQGNKRLYLNALNKLMRPQDFPAEHIGALESPAELKKFLKLGEKAIGKQEKMEKLARNALLMNLMRENRE